MSLVWVNCKLTSKPRVTGMIALGDIAGGRGTAGGGLGGWGLVQW
jgi:hypothetical protein